MLLSKPVAERGMVGVDVAPFKRSPPFRNIFRSYGAHFVLKNRFKDMKRFLNGENQVVTKQKSTLKKQGLLTTHKISRI